MKWIKIIGLGYVGAIGGAFAGTMITGRLITGPHKYGVLIGTASGALIGAIHGGFLGSFL